MHHYSALSIWYRSKKVLYLHYIQEGSETLNALYFTRVVITLVTTESQIASGDEENVDILDLD
jgi:hypothetical protein